jgi:hypothetical protein
MFFFEALNADRTGHPHSYIQSTNWFATPSKYRYIHHQLLMPRYKLSYKLRYHKSNIHVHQLLLNSPMVLSKLGGCGPWETAPGFGTWYRARGAYGVQNHGVFLGVGWRCMSTYVYIYYFIIYIYACMYANAYIYTHALAYIQTYIQTYTYIYIYRYIYT